MKSLKAEDKIENAQRVYRTMVRQHIEVCGHQSAFEWLATHVGKLSEKVLHLEAEVKKMRRGK